MAPGSSEYFFEGSTGGLAIPSVSWTPDLNVDDTGTGGGRAISIGHEYSPNGSYPGNYSSLVIAGFGVSGFTGSSVFVSENASSANGPIDTQLGFTLARSALVVALLGGEGVGSLNMFCPGLQNLSGVVDDHLGNGVDASVDILAGTLAPGSYASREASVLNLPNPSGNGGSIGVAIYAFYGVGPSYNISTTLFVNGTVDRGVTTSIGLGGSIWAAYDPTDRQTWDSGGAVAIVNDSTNTVYRIEAVGSNPEGITFDPRNDEMFVADNATSTLYAVAGGSGRVLGSASVGLGPAGVAYDPRTNEVFVASYGSNNVSVVNASSLRVVATVPVREGPLGIAYVASARGNVIVTDSAARNISVINDTYDVVVGNASVGAEPLAVAYDQGAYHRVYVTNEGSANVSVLNATTFAVVSSISIPGSSKAQPEGIVYDPQAGTLYVPDGSCNGELDVISDSSASVTSQIPAGCGILGVTYDPVARTVYVVNGDEHSLNLYPDSSSTLSLRIPLSLGAKAVVFDSAKRTIFVTGAAYRGLDVVNATTGAVITQLTNYMQPCQAVYVPSAGEVFEEDCATYASTRVDSLVVINDTSNSIVTTVPMDFDGSAIGYDPVHNLVIASSNNCTVSGCEVEAVSPASNSVVWKTPIYAGAFAMAYDSHTEQMLVSTDSTTVSVVNDTTGYHGTALTLSSYGDYLTWDSRAETLWVSEPGQSALVEVNPSSGATLASVYVQGYPQGLTYNPSTDQLLVAVSSGVWVVNASAASLAYVIPLPTGASAVAADPLGGALYLGDGSGALHSLRAPTGGIPDISSFSASPSIQWVGLGTNYTVNAAGPGNLTYTYADLPPGCSSANLDVLPCHLTVTGETNTTVMVGAPTGEATLAVTSVTVRQPSIALSLALSANDTRPHQTVFVNGTIVGGVPPFTQTWTLNGTAYSASGLSVAFTPVGSGNYTFNLTITDSLGERASKRVALIVLAPGSTPGGPVVSVLLSPATAQNGTSVTATASVSGGEPGYTFEWTENHSTASLGTAASVSFLAPSHGGSYTIEVSVIDSAGRTGVGSALLEVIWRPSTPTHSPLSVSLAASATQVNVGGSVVFTAVVVGGVSPYTLEWRLNGTLLQIAGDNSTQTFTHPGVYSFQLAAFDSIGDNATSSTQNVTVVSPTGGATTSTSWYTDPVTWIVIAILMTFLVAVLMMLTRKRVVPRIWKNYQTSTTPLDKGKD